MRKLRPYLIFERYKLKEFDKASLIKYLVYFIEESQDKKERLEALELLKTIDLKDDKIFTILENIMLSDSNEYVRITAAELVIKNYLRKAEKPLKWMFGHESSYMCLMRLIKALEQVNNDFSNLLINYVEEIFGEDYIAKYKIKPSEALGLKFLELKIRRKLTLKSECKDENLHITFFVTKSGHVVELNISKVPCSEADFLKFFPGLKRLTIKNTGLKSINSFGSLINLEFLNLSLNNLEQITSLDRLSSLKTLIITNNNIRELILPESMNGLRTLNVSGNPLFKLGNIENLKHIGYIDLSNVRIPTIKIHELYNRIKNKIPNLFFFY